MVRDYRLYIYEIWESILKIEEYTVHLKEEDFYKSELAGLRDIIAHTYFKIDFKRIWINIKNDIPKIKYDFKEIMEEFNSQ